MPTRHHLLPGFLALAGVLLLCLVPHAAAAQDSPPVPGTAFVQAEPGGLGIYYQASDAPRRVAFVDGDDAPLVLADYLALAPDGRRLAYVTMDNPFTRANATVWIVATDAPGAQPVPLYSVPAGFWMAAPMWSPDGTKLAVIQQHPSGGEFQLWLVGADDGRARVVYQGTALKAALETQTAGAVAWSADGGALLIDDQSQQVPMLTTVDIGSGATSSAPTARQPRALAGEAALPCDVPLLHQNDYSPVMKSCNETIAASGCALTSVTMIFQYYGTTLGPVEMNDCLGNSACPIYWATASNNCSQNKAAFTGTGVFSYTVAATEVAAGRPVVLGMSRSTSRGIGTHFVVITGGSGAAPAGYSINDPYRYNPLRMNIAAYTNEGWRLDRLIRYNGTPACADPDGGDLAFGTTRGGTIAYTSDVDDFFFEAAAGDIVEIRHLQAASALDAYVELYGPGESKIAADDNSAGAGNAFLRRTLAAAGRYRIRALGTNGTTGAYTVRLDKVATDDGSNSCGGDCEGDPQWIAVGQTLTGTITPTTDVDIYYFNGVRNRTMALRMTAITGTLDSYLALYDPNGVRLAVNDDGGGNLNSLLTYQLPVDGAYRVQAYSYKNASAGRYTLRMDAVVTGTANLARNRPVFVSSVEVAGFEGPKAVDGSATTRWSSQYSDPQWIYTDLGENRTVNQVVLKWQGAYARQFAVYVKVSGGCLTCWQQVYTTSSGQGGTNVINFAPVSVRYVLIKGLQRATRYGYSLWEFEVYNTTTAAAAATATEAPSKPEPLPVEAPPPPADPSQGGSDQEYTPTPGADQPDETTVPQAAPHVFAWIRSPDPDGQYRLYTPADQLRFTAEAASSGPAGPLAITGYEWRSDRDGVFGTAPDLRLPVTALSPGLHTIYLRAQDETGAWSEAAITPLFVEWAAHVYLPAVGRGSDR